MNVPTQLPANSPRRLEITEVHVGSPEHKALVAQLTAQAERQGLSEVPMTAKSVRDWQAELEMDGDVATMAGPDGRTYRFSLARWKQSDPDQTLLRIGIRYFNPEKYGGAPPRQDYDLTDYADE